MSKYYRADEVQTLINSLKCYGVQELNLDGLPTIEVADLSDEAYEVGYTAGQMTERKSEIEFNEDCDNCVWNTCNYNRVPWEVSEDAISREEVYRAIITCGEIDNDLNHLYEVIENFPSVIPKPKEGEWIPCSEKLPSEFSDDERVLVTTDVDEMGVIIMPIYDVKSWYRKGYITAWMPLPKPWKGADDE